MEKPNRKVTSGALAGALSVLLVAMVQQFLGYTVSAEVSSSITVVMTFLTSYMVPE